MKRILVFLLKAAAIIYILVCVLLYFFQENLIFFPETLLKDHKFEFEQKFEELTFKTPDHKLLNGLLFKTDSSKGLIFYLHGNAGSLKSWGNVAKTYTALHYDVFILDYRGYGKSEGKITSEKQLYDDVQLVYDNIKTRYPENKIIILGYSIGTGPAAKLASANNAKLLILQAPYYSLTDMMRHGYPIIPTFLLKYQFETYKFIKECKMPVVIFHGNKDEVIYYESSLKLKEQFKKSDTLIILNGAEHNGMGKNPDYLIALEKILKK